MYFHEEYPCDVSLRRDLGMACCFFFQAEVGIRGATVTGVQTCALPIYAEGEGSGAFFSFPWIVAPVTPTARIAVTLATNTWNAYNAFGGRSNYINADSL